MAIKGHCMCGAINVTVTKPADESTYCHCDNCKRQSGASGTYVTMVEKDAFLCEGSPKLYLDKKTDSGTPLERWFCGECGCPIYSATKLMEDKVIVKMALFDEIPKASVEQYCVNKQSWEPNVEGATIAQKKPK